MRPLGLHPVEIRQMYLWECAVILGLDEVDDGGPAPTDSGLHRDPVFAAKPRFRAVEKVERPDG